MEFLLPLLQSLPVYSSDTVNLRNSTKIVGKLFRNHQAS
jgi:hypothetical protein